MVIVLFKQVNCNSTNGQNQCKPDHWLTCKRGRFTYQQLTSWGQWIKPYVMPTSQYILNDKCKFERTMINYLWHVIGINMTSHRPWKNHFCCHRREMCLFLYACMLWRTQIQPLGYYVLKIKLCMLVCHVEHKSNY